MPILPLFLMTFLFLSCNEKSTATGPDSEENSSSSVASSSSSSSNISSDNLNGYVESDFEFDTYLAEDEHSFLTTSYVRIGNQEWTNRNTGASIELKSCRDYEDWECKMYGGFYGWTNLYPPTEVCPEGFYLPSLDAWQELFDFVAQDQGIESDKAGLYLTAYIDEENSDWNDPENNKGNPYGFSAFPAGERSGSSSLGQNIYAQFLATDPGGEYTYKGETYIHFYVIGTVVHKQSITKNKYSIRCVRSVSQ